MVRWNPLAVVRADTQAKLQVHKDLELPQHRVPSAGFSLLLRLLRADRPRDGLRALLLEIVSGYQELDGEIPGPLRLERKARLQEVTAMQDAFRVFDGEPRGTSYLTSPDELEWQQEAIKVSLELFNNVLTKDLEFKRLQAQLPEHPYFRDTGRILGLHECFSTTLGVRHRARLDRFLPLVTHYTAYELHCPLRLQVRVALPIRFKPRNSSVTALPLSPCLRPHTRLPSSSARCCNGTPTP